MDTMHRELKEYLKKVILDKRYLIVLQHLQKANVDYGKSIMLNTKIPIQEVVSILTHLEEMKLIERVQGAALKNTEAKLKLSPEVHKHHTYYTLTKSGNHLLRYTTQDELISAYIEVLSEDDLAVQLMKLAEKLNADHALTYAKITRKRLEEVTPKLEELVRMGILEETNSKIIKFGDRKSKPKKETRTHHKYYGLSRMGELVVREMKRRGITSR
jgi:predicted transcriptional regulator